MWSITTMEWRSVASSSSGLHCGCRGAPTDHELAALRLELAALAVHWGIYASLAAQAATGFTASYLWGPAASIHKAIWNVTLVLIDLHVTAAAWHGFRCDGVVGRMLPLWRRTISGERQRPAR